MTSIMTMVMTSMTSSTHLHSSLLATADITFQTPLKHLSQSLGIIWAKVGMHCCQEHYGKHQKRGDGERGAITEMTDCDSQALTTILGDVAASMEECIRFAKTFARACFHANTLQKFLG